MMQRVKCVVRNEMSGLEQRILVSINFERKRMEEFVDYVLHEYCNVQVLIKIGTSATNMWKPQRIWISSAVLNMYRVT